MARIGESLIPRTLGKIGANTPTDTKPIISPFEGNKSARIIQAGNLYKIVLQLLVGKITAFVLDF
jgi:hypothetical protein